MMELIRNYHVMKKCGRNKKLHNKVFQEISNLVVWVE
jgi:hypothetical protein